MEKRTVQIQMVKNTFDKINGMAEVMHTKSKSDIVKTSIDIADIITRAIQDKSSIIIEDKDGNKTKLIIPGID